MNKKNKIIWFSCIGLMSSWFIYTSWPIWSFFSVSFLGQNHLLVITNEAEQRPCGGFITAYGELSFLPPRLSFHNAYELPDPVNIALPNPLQAVTKTMHFWDMAHETDINKCATNINQAYQQITDRKIDRVWLINTQVFSDLLRVIGSIKTEKSLITSDSFFPVFSRTVANTDRHDENALSERKQPLKTVIKAFALKAILSPYKWRKLLKSVAQAEKNGDIFIQNKSKNISPTGNQIQVIEWNLGGGKTSHSLWSELSIDAREQTPNNWQIKLKLDVQNLAGNDEPLGQYWQGQWQIVFPKSWKQTNTHEQAQIMPGETWQWEKSIDYKGSLSDLDIFVPRGQSLQSEIKISAYPQQIITAEALKTFNNTGTWQGLLNFGSNLFNWQVSTDNTPPFMTMHKPIAKNSLSAELQSFFVNENLIIEVHSNEKIDPTKLVTATLEDRNYSVPNINENDETNQFFVFPDQTTILIGFKQSEKQINERFFLKIDTLMDQWKNQTDSNQNTVIIRQ
jgi:hypothetical protein